MCHAERAVGNQYHGLQFRSNSNPLEAQRVKFHDSRLTTAPGRACRGPKSADLSHDMVASWVNEQQRRGNHGFLAQKTTSKHCKFHREV
jgi:hypothetical protein